MKKYIVNLERTIKQTATVTIEAPDKGTAIFRASQEEHEWSIASDIVRVVKADLVKEE